MNVVLDQDTLEILGVAYRDAREAQLDEPLPESIRALWEALSRSEGGDHDMLNGLSGGAGRVDRRRAHA